MILRENWRVVYVCLETEGCDQVLYLVLRWRTLHAREQTFHKLTQFWSSRSKASEVILRTWAHLQKSKGRHWISRCGIPMVQDGGGQQIGAEIIWVLKVKKPQRHLGYACMTSARNWCELGIARPRCVFLYVSHP